MIATNAPIDPCATDPHPPSLLSQASPSRHPSLALHRRSAASLSISSFHLPGRDFRSSLDTVAAPVLLFKLEEICSQVETSQFEVTSVKGRMLSPFCNDFIIWTSSSYSILESRKTLNTIFIDIKQPVIQVPKRYEN